MIELDFLADHRLRLDDQLDAFVFADLAHDIHHIRGRRGSVHFGASPLGLLGELRQESLELVGDVGLDALELDPELLEIDFFDRTVAVAAPVR